MIKTIIDSVDYLVDRRSRTVMRHCLETNAFLLVLNWNSSNILNVNPGHILRVAGKSFMKMKYFRGPLEVHKNE